MVRDPRQDAVDRMRMDCERQHAIGWQVADVVLECLADALDEVRRLKAELREVSGRTAGGPTGGEG